MLERKIESKIRDYFFSNSNKIMIIDGARQVGKSYIIRHVGQSYFDGYIEINLLEDSLKDKLFEKVNSVNDFYFQLSMIAGDKMVDKEHTLVFLDEIQVYPHLLTLLKFLKQDDKFTYIASGSLLGVTLANTSSIPIGSIDVVHMYPLDFEEFLLANGFNNYAINSLISRFKTLDSLDENTHNKMMDMFKKYLIVGGLPDAVNAFVKTQNIHLVREIHEQIHTYYGLDASKYDKENKLKIKRIYDMIPSNLENKKKRVVVQDIENVKGKKFSQYQDEFDYLINSGIALDVKAISNPTFPLIQSSGKNLLKLYMSDIGILTNILYKSNIKAIMDDVKSINLGSVYENVVASELKAHGFNLFYYDNRNRGEVDFLIDDFEDLTIVPIEVKSGKDYTVHSALSNFVANKEYNIKEAYVLSNERKMFKKGKIIYLPIYMVAFFESK